MKSVEQQVASAIAAVEAVLADRSRVVDDLRCFYDPTGDYAGASFDDQRENVPDDITAADLLATTTMGVPFRPRAQRRLLQVGEDRTAVLDALGRVPQGLALEDATDEDLTQVLELYSRVKHCLDGNKWVTASKLCARKRPALVPVRDSVVVTALGLVNRNAREDLSVLREVARRPGVGADLEAAVTDAGVRKGEGLEQLSTLRVLDAAVWMRHRRGASVQRDQDVDD